MSASSALPTPLAAQTAPFCSWISPPKLSLYLREEQGKRHGGGGCGGDEQEAVRVRAVLQLGAHRGAAQREGPPLRPRRRRPRQQDARVPRHQPLRPDPRLPGRRRRPLRVARHQPAHRHQVQASGPGPAPHAVGQAGDVAGGGVAPLLPGRGRPRVRDPRQAAPAGRRAAGLGRGGRAGAQGCRRSRCLRGSPRRREQVPRRRRLHPSRRQPHGAAAGRQQDAPGSGARRLQATRASLVGGHFRPPHLEEDRRRAPPLAAVSEGRAVACASGCMWVCSLATRVE